MTIAKLRYHVVTVKDRHRPPDPRNIPDVVQDNADGINFAIGRTVRRLRKELGWSQHDLARRAGVKSYQTIASIELGRVKSSFKLDRVAKVLGTNVHTLMLSADEQTETMHPEIGRLVRVLMDREDLTEEELSDEMRVSAEDVDRLLDGDAGPLLWGTAAVVLGVPPSIFERVAVGGLDSVAKDLRLDQSMDEAANRHRKV